MVFRSIFDDMINKCLKIQIFGHFFNVQIWSQGIGIDEIDADKQFLYGYSDK